MNFSKNIALWIIIGLLVLVLFNLFQGTSQRPGPSEMAFSEFLTRVESGDIKAVTIKGNQIFGKYQSGEAFQTYTPNDPQLVQRLKDQDVQIRAEPSEDGSPTLWGILISWFPMLLLIGVWIFFMRQMQSGGGKAMGFGKSKAKLLTEKQGRVTFDDVAGIDEAKQELEEIVEFLKDPQKFQRLGGRIPKGCLLVGPPGTGKTLTARAVAGEANVPFFTISGSDFVEMFVGVGASRVRDMFEQGKKNAPCIIFIDEIDAVGRHRGAGLGGGNDEREQTLNQLLVEMDGFEANEGVILIAATNRPDVLDPALLRPGRFDRQIVVANPDILGREKILKVHMKKVPLAPDVDANVIARGTPGFSGADIANVCNEAALIAARKNKKSVGKQDFLDAVDRSIGGLEKKNKIITQEEKKTIAFHEAGHAMVSWLLEFAAPLVKVTIVPRGQSLGAAWYLPEERMIVRTEQMLDEMCATLGGRAAEKVIFDKISTGALSDLEKVTRQAKAMVTVYGLNEEIGNVTYYDSSGQNDYNFSKPYSEETAQVIDKEISRIIELQYKRACKLVEDTQDKLTALANRLLEKEVIFKDDLVKILGERPYGKTKKDSPTVENTGEETATKKA